MKIKEFDGGLQGNQEITVGIDQSLTGFALSAVSVEFPNQHKTWVFKSRFRGVQRLADIQNWLKDMWTEFAYQGWDVKDVAMEGTVLSFSFQPLVSGELAATSQATFMAKVHTSPTNTPNDP